MTRLAEWNIRHGGGRRIRAIVERLQFHAPDIVVLPEFRNNEQGDALRSGLSAQGLLFHVAGAADSKTNTVLAASRLAVKQQRRFAQSAARRDCILELAFDDFILVAFYFPLGKAKIPVFETLLELADRHVGAPAILIGDLNTGKHLVDEAGQTFIVPEYMDRIEGVGFADAWRHVNGGKREFSWFSTVGNGFRIDHAFASPTMLKRIVAAHYSHAEREERISDHSLLKVDFQ